MIESKHMILSQNNARSGFQNNWLSDLATIHINQSALLRYQGDDTPVILEHAVLAQYVRAAELDILRYISFSATDSREAVLDVIDQTFGHQGILVQIHQVGCLLRGEHANCDAVLFHGDTHFGEHRLALQTNQFGSFQFLLPCFV